MTAANIAAVDLFAGPGGWDEGIAALGVLPVGIEWDATACATREAAGHRTVHGDVALLEPADFGPCDLLIASPPCQAFSMAGKGGGAKDLHAIYEIIARFADGDDRRAEISATLADARSLLVVEPLRWALALEPTWIACEQVPPVLPIWERIAAVLRERGWSTWCGELTSEQYGVPQTRRRALLMASRLGPVAPPTPTHRRFVSIPRERQEDALFDAGPRERIVYPGEEDLLPWISMVDALGWRLTHRPTVTMAMGCATGGASIYGGSGGRASMLREAEAGRYLVKQRGEDGSRECDIYDADVEPSRVVTGKTYSWLVERETADATGGLSGESGESGDHAAAQPLEGAVVRTGQQSLIADGALGRITERYERVIAAPAPTLDTKTQRWTISRPATTVTGDQRVSAPGHKRERSSVDAPGRMEGALRISVAEASVLQGFRRDYPWQGVRTKRFEQIGNAVPPPLARAVVAALLGLEEASRDAR